MLTHSHWDHVFGAAAIDAEAIATEETRDHIATMATYSWSDAALDERTDAGIEIAFCRDMIKAELDPAERAALTLRVPDRTFETELTLDLGGRTVQLMHVDGDHASDSCIVVVPSVVAFLGDCVYLNIHVEPNCFTRRRLSPLLDRLLALDLPHYVLGHHGPAHPQGIRVPSANTESGRATADVIAMAYATGGEATPAMRETPTPGVSNAQSAERGGNAPSRGVRRAQRAEGGRLRAKRA